MRHSVQPEPPQKSPKQKPQPEPPQKSPSRNPESEGRKVSALVISEGFWLNRIPKEWFLKKNSIPWFISWIYIFMGNYFCFHIVIYLRFSTSNLLCLNAHLNCLSLDNHLVFKQPQWQCHVTMIRQRGHLTKHVFNLLDGAKMRRDQNEWFNHYLGLIRPSFINTYFFMPVWCNPLYKSLI